MNLTRITIGGFEFRAGKLGQNGSEQANNSPMRLSMMLHVKSGWTLSEVVRRNARVMGRLQ